MCRPFILGSIMKMLYILPIPCAMAYASLVDEYLEYADGDGRLDEGLGNIGTLIKPDAPGGKSFKRAIADACQGYLNRKSI